MRASDRARSGLRARLGRAFFIHAALISVTAVLGVYAAAFTIEKVLIKRALEGEATHFWRLHETRPGFPAPDTRNLTGYLVRPGEAHDLPAPLVGLDLGFHKLPTQVDFSVVYVTERRGVRLYLVFDGEQVSELAWFFGLVPLAGVLVVLYLIAWVAYRISGRAISPLLRLADAVHRLDPANPDSASFSPERLPGNPDREVVDLAEALSRLSRRIEAFVVRERNFTRDASHELRTPLTVIKLASKVLLGNGTLDERGRESAERIHRAATDMEELTEAFLLLARESDRGLTVDTVCVNDVVAEELERNRVLLADRPVRVRLSSECRLLIRASDKAVSVLVGNLVRNAFKFTERGSVDIRIGPRDLVIEDSGVGIAREDVPRVFEPFVRGDGARQPGHGVGLTIVKRLSDRFGWPVDVASALGVGTRVTVAFPQACREGEGDAREPTTAVQS